MRIDPSKRHPGRLLVELLEARVLLAATEEPLAVLPIGSRDIDSHGDTAYIIVNSQLWKTDGTEAGTGLVKNLPDGTGANVADFAFGKLGSYTVLRLIDANANRTIWITDGTAAGTLQAPVTDLASANMQVTSDGIYCLIDTPSGNELFRLSYNGTTWSGQTLFSSSMGSIDHSSPIEAIGDDVYFIAFEHTTGMELWTTDGTLTGTHIAVNLDENVYGYYTERLRRVDDHFIFERTGGGTYISDGTTAGTRRLDMTNVMSMGTFDHYIIQEVERETLVGMDRIVRIDVRDGSSVVVDEGNFSTTPVEFVSAGKGVYWAVFESGTWKAKVVDGASATASIVKTGVSSISLLKTLDKDWRLIAAGGQLLVKGLPNFNLPVTTTSSIQAKIGDNLVYTKALPGTMGTELGILPFDPEFRPTAVIFSPPEILHTEPSKILDGLSSTDPNGDVLTYEWDLDNDGAFDDSTDPTVVFSTDRIVKPASGHGTVFVKVRLRVSDGVRFDIAETNVHWQNQLPVFGAMPSEITILRGQPLQLTVAVTDADGDVLTLGWDLDNDGVFDDATGASIDIPYKDLPQPEEGQTLAFTVRVKATDPFASATSSDINVIVRKDPIPTTGDWIPLGTGDAAGVLRGSREFALVGGIKFFTSREADSGDFWLYRSDGTDAGTVALFPLDTGTDHQFTVIDQTLYLTGGPDRVLLRTDGTLSGTRAVARWLAHVRILEVIDGQIYFSGSRGNTHAGLWRTDGTDFGTVQVSADARVFGTLGRLGDKLIFAGTEDDEVYLWRTDGRPGSTKRISGSLGRHQEINQFVELGGRLMFMHDRHLWSTDGTRRGTRIVLEGETEVDFRDMFVRNDRLYLTAKLNRLFGLFSTDGTPEGTQLIQPMSEPRPIGLFTDMPPTFIDIGGQRYVFSRNGSGVSVNVRLDRFNEASNTLELITSVPGISVHDFTATPVGTIFTVETLDGPLLYVTDGTADGTKPALPGITPASNKALSVTDVSTFYAGGVLWVAGTGLASHMQWFTQRLAPQAAAPVAARDLGPGFGEGDVLTLRAVPPTDPALGAISYLWDLNGDGDFNDASSPMPRLRLSDLIRLGLTPGETMPVRLRVMSENGPTVDSLTGSQLIDKLTDPAMPTAHIERVEWPRRSDDPAEFVIRYKDAQGLDLTGLALQSLTIRSDTFTSAAHFIGFLPGATGTSAGAIYRVETQLLPADNGAFKIENPVGSQIMDKDGNYLPLGAIGGAVMSLDAVAPTVSLLEWSHPRRGLLLLTLLFEDDSPIVMNMKSLDVEIDGQWDGMADFTPASPGEDHRRFAFTYRVALPNDLSYDGRALSVQYKSVVKDVYDNSSTAPVELGSITLVEPPAVPTLANFSASVQDGEEKKFVAGKNRSGRANLRVTNDSAVHGETDADIQFYLSVDEYIDSTDVLLTSMANKHLSLDGGRGRSFKAKFDFPENLGQGQYVILARLVPKNVTADSDLFDNIAIAGNYLVSGINALPSLSPQVSNSRSGKMTLKLAIGSASEVFAMPGAARFIIQAQSLERTSEIITITDIQRSVDTGRSLSKVFSFTLNPKKKLGGGAYVFWLLVQPLNPVLASTTLENAFVAGVLTDN